MQLRTKLVFLVASAGLLFLLSIGVYFFLQAPLEAMNREVGVFREVERATAMLQVESNRLTAASLGEQAKSFLAAQERYRKALAAVDGVKALVAASPEMADAVQSVKKLGVLADEGLQGVSGALDDVLKSGTDAGQNAGSETWAQLAKEAYSGQLKNSNAVDYYLNNLMDRVGMLNQVLSVTRDVVAAKDLVISNGIAAIKVSSTGVGLAVIFLTLIAALLLSSLMAQSLSKAFHKLGSTVALVGGGNLRLRLGSQRKDELGTLGRDIDTLLESLTVAFRRIQGASAENLQVKDQLAASVSTATASAVQIEANSESILGQLNRAEERIQASQKDLNQVVGLLEAFLVRLEAQTVSVGTTTRAVNDLAEGISSVTELSHQNRQAVEALLAESDRGREVFEHSFSKVGEINDSVAAIQDLVGTIAEIAGQTNILALNAAIEAAHAGEAGKGFAVVADEISKLAAASAASSGQIAETIRDVVTKIHEAGATRDETLGAFAAIGTQIERVSVQGRGIYDASLQMNENTKSIHEAMGILSSNSTETNQEAGRIGAVATQLADTLGQVGRISHEVVSNIGEITTGLGEISRTVSEVADQAERLGRVGEVLDQAVNAFQTEEAAPPAV